MLFLHLFQSWSWSYRMKLWLIENQRENTLYQRCEIITKVICQYESGSFEELIDSALLMNSEQVNIYKVDRPDKWYEMPGKRASSHGWKKLIVIGS